MAMQSWREMLDLEMSEHGESWADIEQCTLSDQELDERFDSGYGSIEGRPFTVWTQSSVYFPTEYDGAENVGRVARHPDGRPTRHIR